FGFGTRAVVHFAVSNREVWMTTKLAGKDTFFLPFNQGDDGHAGNPLNPNGSSTAYLWERILQRDTWLEILQKFVFLKKETVEDEHGRSRRKSTLIFPRFHQWEAVTTMLAAVREEGAGASYLIEHSAGSGKTNTIAWTAHRLLSTYGVDEQRVFDSVIVVTDRTELDDQLQEAVRQIERTSGTVVAVDRKNLGGEATSKSALVKQTLLQGNRIIVVTLQTFPAVLELLKGDSTLAGRTYAVIADEAHSSQTGSAAAKLKRVLTPDEQADLDDGGEADTESILAAEVAATGRPENISFFAFTATPKDKTLQMFGRPSGEYDEKGQEIPASFHRYTMQQAIEEEFILDVLKNFTNYDTAFKLALAGQKGEFRPEGDRAAVGKQTTEVDQTEASKKLMRWVKLHPTNIAQKVKIIVEHFRANVAGLLDGQAKAMVVTDSRAAAVRYKRQ
ncbi:DEAD/DEAH box helicase family protein, partial [Micrococcus yunnanensis]